MKLNKYFFMYKTVTLENLFFIPKSIISHLLSENLNNDKHFTQILRLK